MFISLEGWKTNDPIGDLIWLHGAYLSYILLCIIQEFPHKRTHEREKGLENPFPPSGKEEEEARRSNSEK